mgnify:CR=1 FL=1
MFRTLIWFIYFWLYQIYSLTFLPKLRKLERIGEQEQLESLIHQISRNWAQVMVNLTGSKIQVKGEANIPRDQAVLFVSNHQANFDIPLLLGYIDKPKGFIAKVELTKLPIVSMWMKRINCVFIDRKNVRQSLQAINEGVEILRRGYSLVIFPEGTRSRSNQLGEFKKGSLKLALKAGVPIIPVTINGSYKIMEQSNYLIRPAKVKIVIGKPIFIEQLTEEEKNNLAEIVRTEITKNIEE